jgi:hypothetical protein
LTKVEQLIKVQQLNQSTTIWPKYKNLIKVQQLNQSTTYKSRKT